LKEAPHPIDLHVGAKVRLFRTQRHLSQSNLARSLGISFQQVQKYERGANRVSASALFEIAECLGVGVCAFFEGVERRARPTATRCEASAVGAQVDHSPRAKVKLQIVR